MRRYIRVIDYFDQTCRDNPDKIAVIDSGDSISFSVLSKRSKSIAQVLNQKLKSCNKPIAIFINKSINNVICNLGVSYSNNIYMNLDVKLPKERINAILQHVNPAIILTDNKNISILEALDFDQDNILNIETINFDAEYFESNFSASIIDTDPYCIINTSGSTGTPKAVILNHRSFIDFALWSIDKLAINNSEIIGSLSPSVFDIFSYELTLLIIKSATLVIIPESFSLFPLQIIDLLIAEKVNFIFWVPTIMVNIANLDVLKNKPDLRLEKIFFAGEVFPSSKFNYWFDNFENALFVNLYGPIEITLDCTYFIIESRIPENESIPIGYPCKNTDVLVLNGDYSVTQGEVGELCVRGSSLALGYYNDFEKTSKSFVQNPLNNMYPELIYRTGDLVYSDTEGRLIYIGRNDTLIKHLGYRIELTEIEHIFVNVLKLAKNACALYNDATKQITVFYEHPNEIEALKIVESLKKNIPKYMIPKNFICIKEMPMNNNGKIDRLHLKKLLS
jgi:amino acid adenylation domain-containing protein